MMSKEVLVITCVEAGWDCVMGVFNNPKDAHNYCFEDDKVDSISLKELEAKVEEKIPSYVIHKKRMNE